MNWFYFSGISAKRIIASLVNSTSLRLTLVRFPEILLIKVSLLFPGFFFLQKKTFLAKWTHWKYFSVCMWQVINKNTVGILKHSMKSPTKKENGIHYSYSTSWLRQILPGLFVLHDKKNQKVLREGRKGSCPHLLFYRLLWQAFRGGLCTASYGQHRYPRIKTRSSSDSFNLLPKYFGH